MMYFKGVCLIFFFSVVIASENVLNLFPTEHSTNCLEASIPLEIKTHDFILTVNDYQKWAKLGVRKPLSWTFEQDVHVTLKHENSEDVTDVTANIELNSPTLSANEELTAELVVVTSQQNYTLEKFPTKQLQRGKLSFQWNLRGSQFQALTQVTFVNSLKYVKYVTAEQKKKCSMPTQKQSLDSSSIALKQRQTNTFSTPQEVPHGEFRHG